MSQVRFAAGTVDSAPGADLIAAMREEIAGLYAGLVLDGPDMPRAGAVELAPPHGTFLIGRLDDAPVCCGGLKRLDDRACEIKRMYVVPAARGRGIARTLLAALEDAARELGYGVARLDSGHRQPHALALYASAGYREIANFNANPVATYFAEKPLRPDPPPRAGGADGDLIQLAERALRDAEEEYRRDPSEANRRRVMRAWSEVRTARGEPSGDDAPPYPLPGARR